MTYQRRGTRIERKKCCAVNLSGYGFKSPDTWKYYDTFPKKIMRNWWILAYLRFAEALELLKQKRMQMGYHDAGRERKS